MRVSFKPLLLATAVIGLTMGIGVVSNAQTITLPAQFFSGTTDFAGTFNFAKFDTLGGTRTLLSVELDLTTAFNTQITVTNNAVSGSNGNVKVEVQDGLTDGSFSNVSQVLTVTGGTYQLLDDVLTGPQPYILNPNGQALINTSANSFKTQTFSTAPVLALFTGAGTTGVNYATLTGTVLSNTGGNTNAVQATTATVTADVIYTYRLTGVPEPGAIAMLGSSLVGLTIFGVRRRISRK